MKTPALNLLTLSRVLSALLLLGALSGCLGADDDDTAVSNDDDATANDDDATANDDDATADDDDATADDDDSGGDDDDSAGDDDDSAGDDDDSAGDDDDSAPPVGTVLPLPVTDIYFLTGYFSEWNGGDQWDVVYESATPGACPQRAGDALGDCLAVTYDRDPDGDGTGPVWSGYFWQYPENNWGPGGGWAIPAGATQLSFWAWGATGTESIEFKAGCGGCGDAFELSTGNILLTTTPTEYTISFAGSPTYSEVVGAFAWAENSAPIGTTWTFYVDDVVWE